MWYQKVGERYIVRIASGEPAMDTLTRFMQKEQVDLASLSAIGAARSARLAYWNAETRAYEYREFNEQMEVVSFQGNCALKDGEPFLHVHGVFGRQDFSVIAGHVDEITVHPTLEVWLRIEGVPVHRARDQASGLTLLDLPDELGQN